MSPQRGLVAVAVVAADAVVTAAAEAEEAEDTASSWYSHAPHTRLHDSSHQ